MKGLTLNDRNELKSLMASLTHDSANLQSASSIIVGNLFCFTIC